MEARYRPKRVSGQALPYREGSAIIFGKARNTQRSARFWRVVSMASEVESCARKRVGRSMKILVSAYACEPDKGSEPGAGWNIVNRLAEHHEVWVITRANNRASIESVLKEEPVDALHFVYHDLELLLRPKRLPGGIYWYCYLWQLSLIKVAKALHAQVGFDVTHELTLGSVRFPSSLWKLDIPFVLGPVGGFDEAPLSFWQDFGSAGILKESARIAANRIVFGDPLVRRTYDAAAAVLAVSPQTAQRLRPLVSDSQRMQVLPIIGVSAEDVATGASRPHTREVGGRVLFVGRLVHWKGAHLALRAVALARVQVPSMKLRIHGHGPFAPRLYRLVDELGLTDAVTMTRRLPMADVYALYSAHDIFLFPSLHDSGGIAPLEAMAARLPVVCADIGGPGLSVDEQTGVRIACETPTQLVNDAAAALVRLALDPELRRAMGEAGRQRMATSQYSWKVKALELCDVYEGVASR